MGTDLTFSSDDRDCDRACPPACRCGHRRVVKRGSFRRKHDGATVGRYVCKNCGKSFSDATGTATYRQHKPFLNVPIVIELGCSTAQRRIALKLGINRKTVAKKLIFLGHRARLGHRQWLASRPKTIENVQFDDMETSEHTKLKPLSIPLIVEVRTRQILAWDVAVMPSKGHLAALSRRKYGQRKDDRRRAWLGVLASIRPFAAPELRITSDSNPHYPAVIKAVFPEATHRTVKSRRACTVGQGEMKKGGKDPLFWLNQTAAMLRDNIKQLTRRTWCTTKLAARLNDLLAIYAVFHNLLLLQRKKRGDLPRQAFATAATALIGA